MNRTCGYTLEREIVGVLLDENPQITENQIRQAGGGESALILSVESARRIRLGRLSADLKYRSRSGESQAVAVSMPTGRGVVWEVIPLSDLRSLVDEAASTKGLKRLEAVLRSRG